MEFAPAMGEASRNRISTNKISRKYYWVNNNGTSGSGGFLGRCNSHGGYNKYISSLYRNKSKRSDTMSVICTDGVESNVHPS